MHNQDIAATFVGIQRKSLSRHKNLGFDGIGRKGCYPIADFLQLAVVKAHDFARLVLHAKNDGTSFGIRHGNHLGGYSRFAVHHFLELNPAGLTQGYHIL